LSVLVPPLGRVCGLLPHLPVNSCDPPILHSILGVAHQRLCHTVHTRPAQCRTLPTKEVFYLAGYLKAVACLHSWFSCRFPEGLQVNH
jgi:hypothetical protein